MACAVTVETVVRRAHYAGVTDRGSQVVDVCCQLYCYAALTVDEIPACCGYYAAAPGHGDCMLQLSTSDVPSSRVHVLLSLLQATAQGSVSNPTATSQVLAQSFVSAVGAGVTDSFASAVSAAFSSAASQGQAASQALTSTVAVASAQAAAQDVNAAAQALAATAQQAVTQGTATSFATSQVIMRMLGMHHWYQRQPTLQAKPVNLQSTNSIGDSPFCTYDRRQHTACNPALV